MNQIKILFFVLYPLAFISCNQDKIDKLEHQVSTLEEENRALKSHIEELENTILYYENSLSRYSNLQDQIQWHQQNAQQDQIQWHQQNAQQHLREAEFWRQNGDEFLYESSMRNAQQELNAIN